MIALYPLRASVNERINGLSVEIIARHAILYHRNVWYNRENKRHGSVILCLSLCDPPVSHSNPFALRWLVWQRSSCTKNYLKVYIQPGHHLLAYLHERGDKCLVGATLRIVIHSFTVWWECFFLTFEERY